MEKSMRTSKRKANAFVNFLLKRLENLFSSPFFWVELCVGWSQSSIDFYMVSCHDSFGNFKIK